MTGRLIAVVGPSGVGKDSVMAAMGKAEPNIVLAKRVITRPTDSAGEDFEGVSTKLFEARCETGEFALWWSAHGLQYGIPSSIDAEIKTGKDVLANLSRGVLEHAAVRFERFVVISLTAAPDILRARLQKRGRETREEIESRLERSTYALPDTIKPIVLDNSGPIDDTVARALAHLYPVRAKRLIS